MYKMIFAIYLLDTHPPPLSFQDRPVQGRGGRQRGLRQEPPGRRRRRRPRPAAPLQGPAGQDGGTLCRRRRPALLAGHASRGGRQNFVFQLCRRQKFARIFSTSKQETRGREREKQEQVILLTKHRFKDWKPFFVWTDFCALMAHKYAF